MKLKHIPLYITAVLSISSASILVLLSEAPAEACAFWRLLLATLILCIIGISGGLSKLRLKLSLRMLPLVIIAGTSLGLHFTLWMDSLFRVPVIVSTAVVVTYPVYSLIMEYVTGTSRVLLTDIAGIFIALLGIAVYFHEAFFIKILNTLGVIEAFIASLLASIYFYIGRIIRLRASLLSYILPTYGIGALTVLAYSLLKNVTLIGYSLNSWIYFIMLAVIPMMGGHTVMNYLLRYYSSYTVSSAAFLEPIGASLLALAFLSQVPDIPHIIGALLIIMGVFMLLSRKY